MKAIKSDSRNRPLPSDVPKNFTFKKEAKCTTFLVDMSFICTRMKNHFHIIGRALNLVLSPGELGVAYYYYDLVCSMWGCSLYQVLSSIV